MVALKSTSFLALAYAISFAAAKCAFAPAKSGGPSLAIHDKINCEGDHRIFTGKKIVNTDNSCKCVPFPKLSGRPVESYVFTPGSHKDATIKFLLVEDCKHKDHEHTYIENNLIEPSVTRGVNLRSAWVCPGNEKKKHSDKVVDDVKAIVADGSIAGSIIVGEKIAKVIKPWLGAL
ncbi:hypothetical protein BJ138DRAFT_1195473 [Hygrophoropsis aurantiaca]|uniref:Uncharacterized protein n=1 Tax=Hygrophoropsis aurantiaca TaxID=72124 RepID=A0ACB8AQL8_9AGAM|nr:hypothetical protein BJ138DRAFT_1195473 [Hygrophoropsis aurantiaca]